MPASPVDSKSPAGVGDMFLFVKGARAGIIKGEAQDQKHKDEIEVLAWSWGLDTPSDTYGQASGRRDLRELRVTKRIDRSSTALMSALSTNEPLKQIVLTLRKAGKGAVEFLKITLENGRVGSLEIEAGNSQGSTSVVERVAFTFQKITVDYTPQGQDGHPLGSTTFMDEWQSSEDQ